MTCPLLRDGSESMGSQGVPRSQLHILLEPSLDIAGGASAPSPSCPVPSVCRGNLLSSVQFHEAPELVLCSVALGRVPFPSRCSNSLRQAPSCSIQPRGSFNYPANNFADCCHRNISITQLLLWGERNEGACGES